MLVVSTFKHLTPVPSTFRILKPCQILISPFKQDTFLHIHTFRVFTQYPVVLVYGVETGLAGPAPESALASCRILVLGHQPMSIT